MERIRRIRTLILKLHNEDLYEFYWLLSTLKPLILFLSRDTGQRNLVQYYTNDQYLQVKHSTSAFSTLKSHTTRRWRKSSLLRLHLSAIVLIYITIIFYSIHRIGTSQLNVLHSNTLFRNHSLMYSLFLYRYNFTQNTKHIWSNRLFT